MNTLAYIAACEIESPNAPDFERVHRKQRAQHLARFIKRLQGHLSVALNNGEIEDDQYLELFDALDRLDPSA